MTNKFEKTELTQAIEFALHNTLLSYSTSENKPENVTSGVSAKLKKIREILQRMDSHGLDVRLMSRNE